MNEYDFFCFTFFFTLNFFYFFFFFNKVKKRKLLATALFLDKIERKKTKLSPVLPVPPTINY